MTTTAQQKFGLVGNSTPADCSISVGRVMLTTSSHQASIMPAITYKDKLKIPSTYKDKKKICRLNNDTKVDGG